MATEGTALSHEGDATLLGLTLNLPEVDGSRPRRSAEACGLARKRERPNRGIST